MILKEVYIIINLIAYSITFLSIWDLVLEIKNIWTFKLFNKIIIDVLFLICTINFTYKFTFNLANGYIPLLFFIFIIIGFFIYFLFLRSSYLSFINFILLRSIKLKPFIINLIKELFYNKELILFLRVEVKRFFALFKRK